LVWAIAILVYWPPDGPLGQLFSPDGQLPATPLSHAASLIVMLVLGSIMGLLSIIGDLAFSLFKRQAHVKDYSSALPGHGGVLDRIDSLLLLIPVVYCFMHGL
jgi:CDP-diglyceride synthetase